MTEPRWVKTGDVEEWLRNTFGIFWVSGDDGWEKRIEVVDPDPVSIYYTCSLLISYNRFPPATYHSHSPRELVK